MVLIHSGRPAELAKNTVEIFVHGESKVVNEWSRPWQGRSPFDCTCLVTGINPHHADVILQFRGFSTRGHQTCSVGVITLMTVWLCSDWPGYRRHRRLRRATQFRNPAPANFKTPQLRQCLSSFYKINVNGYRQGETLVQ